MTPSETYLANQDYATRKQIIRETPNIWDSIERIMEWSVIISGAAAIIFVIIPALMMIWRQG